MHRYTLSHIACYKRNYKRAGNERHTPPVACRGKVFPRRPTSGEMPEASRTPADTGGQTSNGRSGGAKGRRQRQITNDKHKTDTISKTKTTYNKYINMMMMMIMRIQRQKHTSTTQQTTRERVRSGANVTRLTYALRVATTSACWSKSMRTCTTDNNTHTHTYR